MCELKSAPKPSPLLDIKLVRMCGWKKSAPSYSARVPDYRRSFKMLKSRRRYYVHGKISTVAREAAWGGVNYASLMDGRIKFGN